jgi:hypothetical protein
MEYSKDLTIQERIKEFEKQLNQSDEELINIRKESFNEEFEASEEE